MQTPRSGFPRFLSCGAQLSVIEFSRSSARRTRLILFFTRTNFGSSWQCNRPHSVLPVRRFHVIHGINLVLLGFHWVLPGFTGLYWVLLGFTGFYRVLPSFTEFQ